MIPISKIELFMVMTLPLVVHENIINEIKDSNYKIASL